MTMAHLSPSVDRDFIRPCLGLVGPYISRLPTVNVAVGWGGGRGVRGGEKRGSRENGGKSPMVVGGIDAPGPRT